MFIINHLLLYRINKLDQDFLNWQIFSVALPTVKPHDIAFSSISPKANAKMAGRVNKVYC